MARNNFEILGDAFAAHMLPPDEGAPITGLLPNMPPLEHVRGVIVFLSDIITNGSRLGSFTAKLNQPVIRATRSGPTLHVSVGAREITVLNPLGNGVRILETLDMQVDAAGARIEQMAIKLEGEYVAAMQKLLGFLMPTLGGTLGLNGNVSVKASNPMDFSLSFADRKLYVDVRPEVIVTAKKAIFSKTAGLSRLICTPTRVETELSGFPDLGFDVIS